MIKIELLYFAQIKEALGRDRELVELEEGQKVADVVTLLQDRAEWRSVAAIPLTFAVNEMIVAADHLLRDGERLAILTPVSGG
jgi:molybdopterin converting factor small subunit